MKKHTRKHWLLLAAICAAGTARTTSQASERVVSSSLQTMKVGFSEGITFSPDGRTLAVDAENGVSLWNPRSGTRLKVLSFDGSRAPREVRFTPNGRFLVTGANASGHLVIWDTKNWRKVREINSGTDWVFTMDVSPDGKSFATGSTDGKIILWNLATGAKRRTMHDLTDQIIAIACSPKRGLVASCQMNPTILIRSVADGRTVTKWGKGGQGSPPFGNYPQAVSLAFSPDGRLLAAGGYTGDIALYNTSTWKPIRTLRGHTSTVWAVAFSPDGNYLASGSQDETAALWDVRTGSRRIVFKGHKSIIRGIAVSPDGRTVATTGWDHDARLWRVQ